MKKDGNVGQVTFLKVKEDAEERRELKQLDSRARRSTI
jgi:hypothetical protein